MVSVDRKTLAKWMKRAPMACLDVSKNLDKIRRSVFNLVFDELHV